MTVKSYLSVKDNGESRLIVWNQGPNEIQNDHPAISVVNCLRNVALSVAYNTIVESYISDEESLVLLDDDSGISRSLFSDFLGVQSYKNTVFVPRIRNIANGEQVYPIFRKDLDVHGLYSCMSGVMIPCETLKALKAERIAFDERWRFYGVDTKFFYDINSKFQIRILPSELQHTLSSSGFISIWRRRERLYDEILQIKLLGKSLTLKTILRSVFLLRLNWLWRLWSRSV